MYYNGLGVKKDIAESIKLFTKASEKGDPDAQGALGEMYANGIGVNQDYVQAYALFSHAAANRSRLAEKQRESVAAHLTSTQLSQALKKAGLQ